MDKLKMHSPDMTQQNIEKIQAFFPNCVTESRGANGELKLAIDFDQLKQELSNSIVEGPQERYHLNWPGKREALYTSNASVNKTLRPIHSDSLNFDLTKNLYVEGDNLDSLKILSGSYFNRVKVIYIDPPYNTGSDFVYSDNFTEKDDSYLQQSEQKDFLGNRYKANLETDGRFHSNWLTMMYSRLRLARNFLVDDGVIFVSIGVEEFSNLKKIMDEIFGENNFVEVFSWVKTSTPPALSTKSRKTNEYILCYEKNKSPIKYNGELLDGGDAPLLNTGNAVRKLVFPKDKVFFSFIENGRLKSGKVDRVSLLSELDIVNGYSKSDFVLEGEFKWTQEFLDLEIKKGTTFIIKSDKLSIRFIRAGEGYKRPTNFIKDKYTTPLINKVGSGVGTNEVASSELEEMMQADVFSYPKPVSLIKYLLNFNIENNDIVMDFFSGSATTAQAVFELSAETGLNINFILVQLAEDLDESLKKATDANVKKQLSNAISLCNQLKQPKVITTLAKERIRRAGTKVLNSQCHEDWNKDVGFRVLKVDTSNMADVYYSPDQVTQGSLDLLVDNIKPDRTDEDLLFQVLLDWGVDLTLPIKKETIQGKSVFFVDDDALVACFDLRINEALIKELAIKEPLRVVFRDDGFESDAVKINAEQIFKQVSPHTEVKAI
ncbi:TPA: site-specific DNA-methyltransferase [Vibrio vulnificus]|nr:type III restriction endonuclease subunit M [Vibrio cholerae]HDY8008594.1 site-specific DNA-methyltransferase [Vibrio vulnificus]